MSSNESGHRPQISVTNLKKCSDTSRKIITPQIGVKPSDLCFDGEFDNDDDYTVEPPSIDIAESPYSVFRWLKITDLHCFCCFFLRFLRIYSLDFLFKTSVLDVSIIRHRYYIQHYPYSPPPPNKESKLKEFTVIPLRGPPIGYEIRLLQVVFFW